MDDTASDSILTEKVKTLAAEFRFPAVGVADLHLGAALGEKFSHWLPGVPCGMEYMRRNVEMRMDPSLWVEGARCAICMAVGYNQDFAAAGDGLIARYACGRDYHTVIKKRCHAMMDELRRIVPGMRARAFVDSAPVMERSLAVAAGLGWIGRNGCLIVPGLGSYVFLCEIICDLPLRFDSPIAPRPEISCDNCRLCVCACPAGAIMDDGLIDAVRCASYLNKSPDAMDQETMSRMGVSIVGCDVCQSVCPRNIGVPCGDAEFLADPATAKLTLDEILDWDFPRWDLFTRSRAFRKVTLDMFLRNAIIVAANSGRRDLLTKIADISRRKDISPGVLAACGYAERILSGS